jgi:hypothetical protein
MAGVDEGALMNVEGIEKGPQRRAVGQVRGACGEVGLDGHGSAPGLIKSPAGGCVVAPGASLWRIR